LAPAASLVSVHHYKGLEQSWLAQCQLKVTGWAIMFICGIWYFGVLGIKTQLESGPVTTDLTTNVVHSSKVLIKSICILRFLASEQKTQGLFVTILE